MLVVSVRPDDDGLAAARRAAGSLPAGVVTVVSHTCDPRLPHLLRTAAHVVVLDPGRVGTALSRLRGAGAGAPALPGAPARARDRLALLSLAREHAGRVRWVGRASQWRATRQVFAARVAAEQAR